MAVKNYVYERVCISEDYLKKQLPTGADPSVSAGHNPVLVISVDETAKADLDAAMIEQGYSSIGESASAPPVTRSFGSLAADPDGTSFPNVTFKTGDMYFNTSTGWKSFNGSTWA